MKYLAIAVLGFSAMSAVSTAQAGEFRLGVAAHDILTSRESGADIEAQFVFDEIDSWTWLFKPQPYVVASTNTEGNISFGGAGLLLNRNLGQSEWKGEFALGLVYHDARTDLPPASQPALRQLVKDTEITYGSEVLFHIEFALGRPVTDNWDGYLYWMHLSHGQILSSDTKNEGLDSVGVKVARKF